MIAFFRIKWMCPLLMLIGAASAFADFGPPPPPKPAFRAGGESFPPLPLPVTPLRRTEKKRAPSAPWLFGWLTYGKEFKGQSYEGAQTVNYDWNRDPQSLSKLLELAKAQIGVDYTFGKTDLNKFSGDPAEIPILYLVGHEGVIFSNEQRKKMREYILKGGTFLAEACCGDPIFTQNLRQEFSYMFPDSPLRPLPPDDPLYGSFFTLSNVSFLKGDAEVKEPPKLEGIRIGCRWGAILSANDLGCGWEGHTHPAGTRYAPQDAASLGLNLIVYVLSNFELGQFLGNPPVYYYQQEREGGGDFVWAQIEYDGLDDPDPTSGINLLKNVSAQTSASLLFKKVMVDPETMDLLLHPFVYLTGHDDFRFTDAAVENLRRYLQFGGFLLADSCCSSKTFDQAFRREMKRILPDSDLEQVEATHNIFRTPFAIERFSLYGMDPAKSEIPPSAEGIVLNGNLAVVYSPYDLGCGWEGVEHPASKGVVAKDALQFGTNVVSFVLSH